MFTLKPASPKPTKGTEHKGQQQSQGLWLHLQSLSQLWDTGALHLPIPQPASVSLPIKVVLIVPSSQVKAKASTGQKHSSPKLQAVGSKGQHLC